MKIRIALVGVVFCLGAVIHGQTTNPPDQNAKSTQSANRVKRQTTSVQKSTIGCVDQQNGKYVMRDEQTSQIIDLESTAADPDSMFARFVGHKVEVSGANSGSSMRVTQIHQVADMCGTGK